jgi:hypothetical protein
MHENIFTGLTLDEPVALRSIEPLHCSLFLAHFHYLEIEIALPLLVRFLVTAQPPPSNHSRSDGHYRSSKRRDSLQPAKKGRKVCPCSPSNESKGNTRATNAIQTVP